jgi:hypothetical protein
VLLRLQPRLTLWVDHIEYISDRETITTIVFAAINGTIQNGASTAPTELMKAWDYGAISALACSVDVTLIEDQFIIGEGSGNNVTLSSFNTLSGPADVQTQWGGLGDLAAWLGAVVTDYGVSVHGAQPMFETNPVPDQNPLPVAYTTTLVLTNQNDWQEDML